MALKKVFFLPHFHGYVCRVYFDDHMESGGNCWIRHNISSALDFISWTLIALLDRLFEKLKSEKQ